MKKEETQNEKKDEITNEVKDQTSKSELTIIFYMMLI